jgi:hypothetical protein
MADRVSASITIGGVLDVAAYHELAIVIAEEGLSTEWDSATFAPDHRTEDEPLRLYAHEVPWGRFERLELYCANAGLPFARWSGGYGGEWGAERVVFTGSGESASYAATEDDEVMMGRQTANALGSCAAIIAHFDAADFVVPPLVVVANGKETCHG